MFLGINEKYDTLSIYLVCVYLYTSNKNWSQLWFNAWFGILENANHVNDKVVEFSPLHNQVEDTNTQEGSSKCRWCYSFQSWLPTTWTFCQQRFLFILSRYLSKFICDIILCTSVKLKGFPKKIRNNVVDINSEWLQLNDTSPEDLSLESLYLVPYTHSPPTRHSNNPYALKPVPSATTSIRSTQLQAVEKIDTAAEL